MARMTTVELTDAQYVELVGIVTEQLSRTGDESERARVMELLEALTAHGADAPLLGVWPEW